MPFRISGTASRPRFPSFRGRFAEHGDQQPDHPRGFASDRRNVVAHIDRRARIAIVVLVVVGIVVVIDAVRHCATSGESAR